MKKTLSLVILFVINASIIYAQQPGKVKSFKAVPVKNQVQKIPGSTMKAPSGACDTVNLDAANNWQAFYYTYGTDGYIFGTSNNSSSGFNLIEDANRFDVSAYDYTYISGGLVYFAKANSDKAADLNKDIVFKVYDDANGSPGTLLGSTSLTLSQVHQDVMDENLTEFKFASPIAIPASKTFYISIDHSNFKWNNSVKDTIAIIASGDEDTTADAFQKFSLAGGGGDGWIAVNELWSSGGNPLDVNLFVFPYVSNSVEGCGLLPVNILNFGGNIKNNQAILNWSTAGESNNKGFYVERSKDGQNFSSIGFVNGAGNSNKMINYTYTDISLKDINVTTTYYRLKQMDFDGKTTYSKVLQLDLKNVAKWRFYPNPVKDVATVEVNLATASKVSLQVIARDGRIVLNADKGTLTAGTQQVFVNTQSMAKGSYIIRLTAGDKTYSIPFVKE